METTEPQNRPWSELHGYDSKEVGGRDVAKIASQ